MEFKLNTSARETTINKLAEEQIQVIKKNLDNGERITEMYIPKEFASDVKSKLDELLKDQNFNWEIVKREPNQYTGRMQYFTGMVVGNDKYYKLKYYGD